MKILSIWVYAKKFFYLPTKTYGMIRFIKISNKLFTSWFYELFVEWGRACVYAVRFFHEPNNTRERERQLTQHARRLAAASQ